MCKWYNYVIKGHIMNAVRTMAKISFPGKHMRQYLINVLKIIYLMLSKRYLTTIYICICRYEYNVILRETSEGQLNTKRHSHKIRYATHRVYFSKKRQHHLESGNE